MMEYIKIFLASSIIRFHYERLEIADCIRALNDRYIEKGIYFKLFICEDESDMLSMTRKQDEYNNEIKSSDYFYMFIADSLGEYTLEEFNTALTHFREMQSPRIYTYFYQFETAGQFYDKFMKRLDEELGHYYSVFSNIDSIKLHILMELISDPRISEKARVEFRNGFASIDNVPMIPLSKIPAFNNNQALQENILKLKTLNAEFARLAVEYANAPQDTALLGRLSANAQQRNELENQIHTSEKLLFDLMKMTCDRKEEGSWRTQEALKEIEAGNYEGALNILRDAQRTAELNHAEKQMMMASQIRASALIDIENYIEENLLRIQTIELSKKGTEKYAEIIQLYTQNFELFLKYNVGEESVSAFLFYLLAHNKNKETIEVTQKIHNTSTKNSSAFSATVLNIEGSALVAMNQLNEAKEKICEALHILSSAGQTTDSKQLLIDCCLNYGNVLFALNDYSNAQKAFYSAYDMLHSTENTDRALIDRFIETCINLGSLFSDLNKRSEAEEYYKRAMSVLNKYTNLSLKDLKNKAILYNNLSVLSVQNNDLTQAEQNIESATKTAEQGEATDPTAFLAVKLMADINAGMVMLRKGNNLLAKQQVENALHMWEILSAVEPDTYAPHLAMANHNLGIICALMNDQKSNDCFKEAESIEKKLAENHSAVFRAYSAITKITEAALIKNCTPSMLEECIRISDNLVNELSPAYRSYLGMALLNAGIILYNRGDTEDAVNKLNRALEIYSIVSEFTGERNLKSSYKDVLDDINDILQTIRNKSKTKISHIWYMEIYEIWNGQISGMPVRAKTVL